MIAARGYSSLYTIVFLDLPTSGSLHAQLTLLCNKTHILSTFDVIDAARESWYYSYFVYIDCVNVNGSQVSNMRTVTVQWF